MQIRPMTPSDQEKVAHLLQELWGHNPLMLRQYQVHRGDWPIAPNVLRKSIVVETGDEIAATGTLFESTLHPRYHVVTINVAQAGKARGSARESTIALRPIREVNLGWSRVVVVIKPESVFSGNVATAK